MINDDDNESDSSDDYSEKTINYYRLRYKEKVWLPSSWFKWTIKEHKEVRWFKQIVIIEAISC